MHGVWDDGSVRILLWHGYLLGGTGSNVYTRALAREWSRAGHDVVVVCQEPHPERFDLGGARSSGPTSAGCCPSSCSTATRASRRGCSRTARARSATRYVDANAAALRAQLPADLVFANHVLLGGAVGAATGARFAVKAHGSELEYSMRGQRRAGAVGAGVAAPTRRPSSSAPATSAQVLEEVVGHVDRVHEVPPGVDVDEFAPQPRDEALAGLLEEARRDPPNPGNAKSGSRTRATQSGSPSSSPATSRPSSTSGSSSTTRASTCCSRRCAGSTRARSSSASATTGRSSRRWRRRARSSPARSSTATSSTCSRSRTSPSCRRSSRRRSGWSPPRPPPPARRRSSRGTRASPRSPTGSRPSTPSHLRELASFATGDAVELAAGCAAARASARRLAGAPEGARRAAVERWSWAGVARRLLDALD